MLLIYRYDINGVSLWEIMMSVVNIIPRVFTNDAASGGFEPSTHVDLGIDYKKFLSARSNNYIIEGIRGTGKTHIMKMIVTEAKTNFSKYKIMPIMISIANAPEVSKNDDGFARVFIYTEVINRICTFILENKEVLESASPKDSSRDIISKIKNVFSISSDTTDISSIINEIRNLAKSILDDMYDNPNRIVKSVTTDSENNLMFNAGAQNIVNVDAGVGKKKHAEETKEYTTQKLSDRPGVDVIVSFLRQIIQMLKINYIYLLFDECSDSTDILQREVFRLCKQIRGAFSENNELNNPSVAFMLGVYPPEGTYYPSLNKKDSFTFQPGNDCSIEYLEMDELSNEFESFFLELIENRLRLNENGPTKIEDTFDDTDSIMVAAYCSNGLPRRFLAILEAAYNQLKRDFENKQTTEPKKIDSAYVLYGIRQVIESPILLNDPSLLEEDQKTLEAIITKLYSRNKREISYNRAPQTIYIVTAQKSSMNKLSHLIINGSIHNKKRSRARKSSAEGWSGKGSLYSLDLGIAFHRGVLPENSARFLEACRSDLSKAFSKYVLDITLEDEETATKLQQIEKMKIEIAELQIRLEEDLYDGKITQEKYNVAKERYANIINEINHRASTYETKTKNKENKTS